MKMYRRIARWVALPALSAWIALAPAVAQASDHDDGDSPLKTQALNLTDLYAFREDNQTGSPQDKGNLILILNSSPRSVPGKQYDFSTQGTYEFHLSRVQDKNATPNGADDIAIRFQFGDPDGSGSQPITVSLVREGATTQLTQASGGSPIRTTPIAQASSPLVNQVSVGNSQLSVFAGLREDPFYFDSEQFFKVRAGALGQGAKVGFRSPEQAVDFASGYNVNSIVLRIPISLLQAPGGQNASVFDIWETVSVGGQQIERLARPLVNEGLITSNDLLNAFNGISPSQDLSTNAAPIRAEATGTIAAFDALDGTSNLTPEAISAAFLPDVMRLDTSVDIPFGMIAYNAALSGDKNILIGGRKIEDDVVDIMMSYLVAGDLTGSSVRDNVSYSGIPGNPAQPGHKLLNRQNERLGAAAYPFLAAPH